MARYRRNHTEKKHVLYALVDPVSPPPKPASLVFRWVLVEAPGTAPGSEWFIATAIYFHSRRTGTPNIGRKCREKSARPDVKPSSEPDSHVPRDGTSLNLGWPRTSRRLEPGSDGIRTRLQLFVLTRFLHANRFPLRS